MGTEGGRISNLLSESRCCVASSALAKARAFRPACVPCSKSGILKPAPSLPSMLLTTTVASCYSSNLQFGECVPESIRIARVQQKTIDESTNPSDPSKRFSAYERFFPEPCDPIPSWYATAGEPILQGKNCALPNKPDNPVLPG